VCLPDSFSGLKTLHHRLLWPSDWYWQVTIYNETRNVFGTFVPEGAGISYTDAWWPQTRLTWQCGRFFRTPTCSTRHRLYWLAARFHSLKDKFEWQRFTCRSSPYIKVDGSWEIEAMYVCCYWRKQNVRALIQSNMLWCLSHPASMTESCRVQGQGIRVLGSIFVFLLSTVFGLMKHSGLRADCPYHAYISADSYPSTSLQHIMAVLSRLLYCSV
jgi:hypothetical protein